MVKIMVSPVERRQPDPLMTIDQVAAYLGISKNTIYRWNAMGVSIPHFKLGKHLRFRRSDVEKFLEEHRDEVSRGIA